MKKILFLLIFIPIFLLNSALASDKLILVTGAVVNNSSVPWGDDNFNLRYVGRGHGLGLAVNIAPYQTPAKGKFIIPVTVGLPYVVSLVTTGTMFPNQINICVLSILAKNSHEADIKVLAVDDSTSVKCRYTGNPNDHTAAITITNS